MANYRSAMGKDVDMASLIAKNENTRAVGNMNVNARGDTIDALGRVTKPITEKVNKAYSNTVGTRSANQVRQIQPQQPIEPSQLAPAERVSCFIHHRLIETVGDIPLAEAEANYDRQLATQATEMAASLKANSLHEFRGS
jgi:hypothetical protein